MIFKENTPIYVFQPVVKLHIFSLRAKTHFGASSLTPLLMQHLYMQLNTLKKGFDVHLKSYKNIYHQLITAIDRFSLMAFRLFGRVNFIHISKKYKIEFQ